MRCAHHGSRLRSRGSAPPAGRPVPRHARPSRPVRRVATVLLLLAIIAGAGWPQDTSLQEYNIRRDQITAGAMTVLASWSAVNLAAGTTLALTTEDPELAAFHQMNAGWNIVNAALAIPSLLGARARLADPPSPDLTESLLEQNTLEDILLFNAGLDVGYIAAGFYLTERARRNEANAEALAGFGYSLMVQGGFLLVFDLVVYALQRQVGVGLAEYAGE